MSEKGGYKTAFNSQVHWGNKQDNECEGFVFRYSGAVGYHHSLWMALEYHFLQPLAP